MARNDLATYYWWAGRTDEATALAEKVLADSERVLGVDHPQTHSFRENLRNVRIRRQRGV
jgi:hypothetical protein